MLLPEGSQTLLLCGSIDIGSNDEGDDVEERHPGFLREELLGKGQSQRGSDPADLHDGEKTGANGGADLVDGTGTGDQSHGGEVDSVLDRGDLGIVSDCGSRADE